MRRSDGKGLHEEKSAECTRICGPAGTVGEEGDGCEEEEDDSRIGPMDATVCGLVIYWRLIVKRRGSNHTGTIRCSKKKGMEEELQELVAETISSAEGGFVWFLAQNHEAGSSERRLTGFWKIWRKMLSP